MTPATPESPWSTRPTPSPQNSGFRSLPGSAIKAIQSMWRGEESHKKIQYSPKKLDVSSIHSRLSSQFGDNSPQVKLREIRNKADNKEKFDEVVQNLSAIFGNPHDLVPYVERLSAQTDFLDKLDLFLANSRAFQNKISAFAAIEEKYKVLQESQAPKQTLLSECIDLRNELGEFLAHLGQWKDGTPIEAKYERLLQSCDDMTNKLIERYDLINQMPTVEVHAHMKERLQNRALATGHSPPKELPPLPILHVHEKPLATPLFGRVTVLTYASTLGALGLLNAKIGLVAFSVTNVALAAIGLFFAFRAMRVF